MRPIIVAIASSTMLATPVLAAAPAVWTISEASPGVTVTHAGLSRAALRGGRLTAGDIVSTGSNARAVLVRGEQFAIVAPGSRLEVTDPEVAGRFTQFLEKMGSVVFSVKKAATPHFAVRTPYLAAVVKGTTFSVTVDEKGASVQVVEGAVEVASNDGGAHELVTPGMIATIGADDLGKLSIEGSEAKVVHSERAPASPSSAGPTASVETPGETADVESVKPGAAPGDTVTIGEVDEPPQSLSQLSGGLVSDDAGASVTMAAAGGSAADHAVDLKTGKLPNDNKGSGDHSGNGGNGNSGNGGSGNSGNGGNGNSGSGGNGNSGSGGNGNSGNGGSGNSGNGGNGNSGNGGSGNSGNGGSGNSGNGGNGNSGSGGNGNGSGKNGNLLSDLLSGLTGKK